MTEVRQMNEKKYGIGKHRFLELRHHCLQYEDWKRELESMKSELKAIEYGKDCKGSSGCGSQTEHLAIKRMQLEEKCKTIEQTAIEADAEIYPWILEGVTTDYATYRYLRDARKMPCGDQKYYRARRKFYWLLSKKI